MILFRKVSGLINQSLCKTVKDFLCNNGTDISYINQNCRSAVAVAGNKQDSASYILRVNSKGIARTLLKPSF